ncbi:aldose epimerase family protein [Pseudooctadecabacter jejudonensis]|uniref:Aldose 1-epimerase n=1 Tax=Pseudooctadecabacter jejudonensis TaxID=1391910 RepID=A0A1Y5T4H7_9RHOB|nr:aldose epimerase family protein [Pseudooctadecabacter jejudonensis]SLN55041.1 Aldose 1-epimerase precursor [Pseudooctadecabacter jejudonensis]
MKHFGTTQRGRDVDQLTLTAHGLTVSLLTLGAIVQGVWLDGIEQSLTVGSDDLTDYEGDMLYHGAIVGPVANRIGGGKAVIDGIEHQLERNQDGRHTLHGGTRGPHTRIWTVKDHSDNSATLALSLPDGDCGLPGNRVITAHYAITEGPALSLSITTQTDTETWANLTNHSYWCLDGSGHMANHTLQITADTVLPIDADSLPTGDILPVEDTAFDFRRPRALILGETRYDNTYPVAQTRRALTPVLKLATDSVAMTVSTTEPGAHIYDDGPAFAALAIECQGWPNAPAHAHFPSITVMPDTPLTQTTEWRFARI